MVKDGVIGHRPGFGHHEDLWASAPPFCTGETQASEAKIKVGTPSPDRSPMLPLCFQDRYGMSMLKVQDLRHHLTSLSPRSTGSALCSGIFRVLFLHTYYSSPIPLLSCAVQWYYCSPGHVPCKTRRPHMARSKAPYHQSSIRNPKGCLLLPSPKLTW